MHSRSYQKRPRKSLESSVENLRRSRKKPRVQTEAEGFRSEEVVDNRRTSLGGNQDVHRPKKSKAKNDRLSFSSSSSGSRAEAPIPPVSVSMGQPFSGRTKNFFTEDEVQAIREGVAEFGVGEWQTIKANSNGRLLTRSAVQIKDKYRNLVRTGQI